MKFDSQVVNSNVWMPAVLIALGYLFQVGYFYSFGIEFLTAVGAGDWLFSLLVMSIPLLFYGIFIVWTANIGRHFLGWFENWRQSALGQWVLEPFPGWVWLLLLMYLISSIRFNFPASSAYLDLLWLVLILGLTASFWDALERNEDFSISNLGWTALGWGILAFWSGYYFGVAGGRVCTFSLKDGRQLKAVYMRTVADGHLMRLANTSYFLEKSTVEEIRCAWAENSMDARFKLAFPNR